MLGARVRTNGNQGPVWGVPVFALSGSPPLRRPRTLPPDLPVNYMLTYDICGLVPKFKISHMLLNQMHHGGKLQYLSVRILW